MESKSLKEDKDGIFIKRIDARLNLKLRRTEWRIWMEKQYETIIGLEVHVELATASKIFCGCSTRFGEEHNTRICPVCAGMPGSLPVLNRRVVEYALALGLALHCEVNRVCRFDRKNYFYPDNPQNYQISQLYLPICHDGYVEVEAEGERKKIRIHEMHMEEDAGKLIHDDWKGGSLVDYNRSGVPLVEIVTEPDMRSAKEAAACLEKLRMICRYLGASDCKLQEGSMRADVNLSVRETGGKELGTRTEMKNLNSFKAIIRAVEAERKRQIEILESGRRVIQETRRWDDNKECSYTMRSKEDARDYRYFPDPDLPSVTIGEEEILRIISERPEMQEQKAARYEKEWKLSASEARLLTQSRHLAELFEKTAKLCGKPKKAANWFSGELLRLLKEEGMEPEELDFSPEHAAALIKLQEKGEINGGTAKLVFEQIFRLDVDPAEYVEKKGLRSISDTDALTKTVEEVLAENQEIMKEYRSGKTKVLGYFIGQVMKKTKGKADPGAVNQIVLEKLQKPETPPSVSD